MGRKAGVTAEQTRAELLAAAARVFSLKGYDGASIADITSEAGLTSGAVYAHYRSKAELFVAVLEAHGQRQYLELLGNQEVDNVADFLTMAGSSYDSRRPAEAALVLEAIVASVATRRSVSSSARGCAPTRRCSRPRSMPGKRRGCWTTASAETISRLATMLAFGSFLTAMLDVSRPDHDDWNSVTDLDWDTDVDPETAREHVTATRTYHPDRQAAARGRWFAAPNVG